MLDLNYAWYIEGDNIAIVEQNTDSDLDTDWDSISTASKTIRIFAKYKPTDFDTILTDDDKTYNIPNRYRDLIASYAIAKGYEDPRNQDFKAAGYFLAQLKNGIKRMKISRNTRKIQGAAHVKPQYF